MTNTTFGVVPCIIPSSNTPVPKSFRLSLPNLSIATPHLSSLKMHIKKYLTKESVIEIFAARPDPSPVSGATPTKHELARVVADQYGVSSSTIQQIWNRKCWAKITAPFCDEAQSSSSTTQDQPANSDPEIDGSDSETCSLFDDIEQLSFHTSEDPFMGQLDTSLANIDLKTMVSADHLISVDGTTLEGSCELAETEDSEMSRSRRFGWKPDRWQAEAV
eukprot:229551-Rhodomonas_salina.1